MIKRSINLNKAESVKYIYNSSKAIESVIIPYQDYLNLKDKVSKSIHGETIPGGIINYNLILDAINELRGKNWTLTKIAGIMSISQSNLSRLINNPTRIKHDTLSKYMDNLDQYLED